MEANRSFENCILSGSVSDLRSLLTSKIDSAEMQNLFFTQFGMHPSPSEVASWDKSLPVALKVLEEGKLGDAICSVEYALPFDYGRCDLILFGRSGKRLNVVVVELKQWTKIGPFSSSREIVSVGGLGLAPHPSYQVLNYAGKIRNFHSVGVNSQVASCAFAHNLDSTDPDAKFLISDRFTHLTGHSPVFFADQNEIFVEYVTKSLDSLKNVEDSAADFCSAAYLQSKQLFDGIKEHAIEISDRVCAKVIETGWGLSDTQLAVKEKVFDALSNKRKVVFLVRGEPGSGKTLVALYLLLETLKSEKNVILSFRNSRLMATLRKCLDQSIPGASGLLKYLGDARDPRKGLVNSAERFDLVIVDEGQRIKDTDISKLLGRSDIFVVLYDEYQMLVPYEGGYRSKYVEQATEAGFQIEEFELSAARRCRGGRPYQEWIDQLLKGSDKTQLESLRTWKPKYELKVFDSLSDMIEQLRDIQARTKHDVCLLASFTESDGKKDRIRTQKPKLLWAMENAHYIDFWMEKGSNRLDQCASVYGCQGFERLYAGVIWGRDYCMRNGKWTIPQDHTITDAIGSSGHRLVDLVRKSDPRALELLFNRYRIMLTRGIFGTYIYAEDDETREYLLARQ